MTIEKIRISIGSASVIGLYPKEFEVQPTTCYLMTYKEGSCSASCGFCPQARGSSGKTGRLSRIIWPVYEFKEFFYKLKYLAPSKRFKRICIQTLNYRDNYKDLADLVTEIRRAVDSPISAAIPPMPIKQLKELKTIGVNRIGIALDGATPEIFNKCKGEGVKGPYTWEGHHQAFADAIDIFSKGEVSTHLIVGLGETEKDMIRRIADLNRLGILVSLFAFTPVKGTPFGDLKKPDLVHFRKIQLGRYLIVKKDKKIFDFTYNSKGEIINIRITKGDLRNIIEDHEAFMTSGCVDCNRPYYTSRPSGPTYNFPRKLTLDEKDEIYNSLERFVQ